MARDLIIPPRKEITSRNEARFRRPDTLDEASFARLGAEAKRTAEERFALYQQLAGMKAPAPAPRPDAETAEA